MSDIEVRFGMLCVCISIFLSGFAQSIGSSQKVECQNVLQFSVEKVVIGCFEFVRSLLFVMTLVTKSLDGICVIRRYNNRIIPGGGALTSTFRCVSAVAILAISALTSNVISGIRVQSRVATQHRRHAVFWSCRGMRNGSLGPWGLSRSICRRSSCRTKRRCMHRSDRRKKKRRTGTVWDVSRGRF